MTGCAAASAPPQVEIQRSALSNDEVQHALSTCIAVPAVGEGVKEGVKEDVKEDVMKEEGMKEDVMKEEGMKEDVKEDVKEESVKDDMKDDMKEEVHSIKTQETLTEEPEVEMASKEEAMIASKSDCCIVMWCLYSTNNVKKQLHFFNFVYGGLNIKQFSETYRCRDCTNFVTNMIVVVNNFIQFCPQQL